jgi:hypothetical protein
MFATPFSRPRTDCIPGYTAIYCYILNIRETPIYMYIFKMIGIHLDISILETSLITQLVYIIDGA